MKGFLCLRTRQIPRRKGSRSSAAGARECRPPGSYRDNPATSSTSTKAAGGWAAKAASVRDKDGRILDHGLHVWLGFYENAFRMMRECYAEVERAARSGRSRTAASTRPSSPSRTWASPVRHRRPRLGGLVLLLPAGEGRAGDRPRRGQQSLHARQLPAALLRPAQDPYPEHHRADQGRCSGPGAARANAPSPTRRPTSTSRSAPPQSGGAPDQAHGRIAAGGHLDRGRRDAPGGDDHRELAASSSTSPSRCPTRILNLMEAVAAQMRKLLRDLTDVDENIRMRTEVIDIVITIAVGLFRDRVLFDDRGLDAINQFDYREWLRNHGATKTALEVPLPDRDLRLRLRLRGRRAPEAASRRRRGGARGAADVLHLSRRDVLARAVRHGRRRLRTALQGARSSRPESNGDLAGQVSFPPRARGRRFLRRGRLSRRGSCVSEGRPTGAGWTG